MNQNITIRIDVENQHVSFNTAIDEHQLYANYYKDDRHLIDLLKSYISHVRVHEEAIKQKMQQQEDANGCPTWSYK